MSDHSYTDEEKRERRDDDYRDDEKMEGIDWTLKARLDQLVTDNANEKRRADAAEKVMQTQAQTIVEQEARIATAWRERDEAVKNFREIDKLLVEAIRLLAFFAGKRP